MKAGDAVWMSAVELVEAYRSRALSPVAVAEAHLDRIERLDGRLNSFITKTADRARARARESEARYAKAAPLSALDGVPYAVKDNYATAGVLTTHGSKLGRGNVPAEDAVAVERMEKAGAVLLGKLNLWEFATGSGVESGFGPVRNPWNLERDPGGSSSGSGAALAAGLTTLALGTDTGGSIRSPAARCSIVGIKPTYGRVPRHGVTPLAWTLDHAGPMARSVRDAARMLDLLAGPDPRDPSSADEPVGRCEDAVRQNAPLRGRRFAIAPELIEGTDPAVRAVFDAAVGAIEAAGAQRIERSLPGVRAMNVAAEILVSAEAAVFHEDNMRTPEKRDLLDPAVRLYATSGRFYLATDYIKAQRLRGQLRAELHGALADADVLLCPTDPTLAPEVGGAPKLGGRELMWFEYGTMNLGNLTGAPALSVPCGFTPDGMPVGLQMYGRAFDEASVLAFGHAYEQSAGWRDERPPLP